MGEASTTEREIVLTRVLDAPRELVWRAFTEAEHVAQWWGPDGFRNTIHEMSVRPEGVWRFIMHGPDGTDYPNRIDFIEVVEPERLVYWHGDDEPGRSPSFHVTTTFEDEGGKTRLTMRLLFETKEARDRTVEFGAIEGGKQTLARLEAYLKTM
jgi:uncharacterized protein YndB with AHSA1/START domain